MKRFASLLFSALLLPWICLADALSIQTEGAELGSWTQDWDAAVALSKEKNLPIFALFTGSDWCPYCVKLHDRIFVKEAWQTWAKDKVVLAYIDFPRDESKVPEAYRARNNELQQRYGITGFPTCFLLSVDEQDGMMLFSYSDSDTAESFANDVATYLPLANRGGLRAALSSKEWSQYQEASEKRAKAKAIVDAELKIFKAELEALQKEGKDQEQIRAQLKTKADALTQKIDSMNAAHRVMMALLKRAQKKIEADASSTK